MSPHPSMVTWVAGKMRVEPCDCSTCVERSPAVGAAIVLILAALVSSFVLWVIG
jgi:hypothetical protein